MVSNIYIAFVISLSSQVFGSSLELTDCYIMFTVFISWRLRRPYGGNADGAEGIFGSSLMRLSSGPTT